MFAHAMGVAPFKDNFWSTTKQPGNPYGQHEGIVYPYINPCPAMPGYIRG